MDLKAFEYLSKDVNKNVGMIECLKHHDCEMIYNENDGVFMLDRTAGIYMLSTDVVSASERATDRIAPPRLVVCNSEHDYTVASKAFDLNGLNKCYQVIWEGGKLPLKGVCEIKKLAATEENIDFVFNHYTLAYTKEHIAEEIASIGMLGAYLDGRLVGFIGRHDEMSMGLLEVLPECRRMGIATELESQLINEILDMGQVPYAHIICDNEKSLNMHRSKGFTFSEGFIYWIFKK